MLCLNAPSLFYITKIFTGELSTKEPLDRESRAWHEVIVEAKDQDGGVRGRSKRVKVRVAVTDVNDNAPVIVDPQQDVVAVREQQPPGVEVVTVKATDPDQGNNATLTYSILKGTSLVNTFCRTDLTYTVYMYRAIIADYFITNITEFYALKYRTYNNVYIV